MSDIRKITNPEPDVWSPDPELIQKINELEEKIVEQGHAAQLTRAEQFEYMKEQSRLECIRLATKKES